MKTQGRQLPKAGPPHAGILQRGQWSISGKNVPEKKIRANHVDPTNDNVPKNSELTIITRTVGK